MLSSILLILPLGSVGSFQSEPPRPTLRAGQTIEGTITDDDPVLRTETLDGHRMAAPTVAKTFDVEVEQSGPHFIELRSYLFDAYLVLRDADGNVLAEDDDGLVEAHARIAIDRLEEDATYHVDAGALHGHRGSFQLRLVAGTPSGFPSPEEREAATLAEARRRVETIEEVMGAESPRLADALLRCSFAPSLGLVTRKEYQEQAHALYSRILPGDHPSVRDARAYLVQTLLELAGTLRALGSPDALARARDLGEQAFALRSRHLPADHGQVIKAQWDLAWTLHELGTPDALVRARALREDVIARLARVVGPDSGTAHTARLELARTLRSLGEHGAARDLVDVVADHARSLPDDHADAHALRRGLGAILHEQGELEAACTFREHELTVLLRTRPDDHLEVAMARGQLAHTLMELGDSAAARDLYERVVDAFSRTPPDDPGDRVIALSNLACLTLDLGDLVAARELIEKALALGSRTLPDDHDDSQHLRAVVARTMREAGEPAAARELQERVLAAYLRTRPADGDRVQDARADLALTLWELGDLFAARELLEQAVEAFSKRAHTTQRLLSHQGNLATLLFELGESTAARHLQEQVLEAYSRLRVKNDPGLLILHANLILTLRTLGDLDAAREVSSALLDRIRDQALALRVDSPRVAREGARLQLACLHVVIGLAGALDASPSLSPALFAALENVRHASVASPEVALAFGEEDDLEESRRAVAVLRARLNDRVALGPRDGEDVEAWRADVARIAAERDRQERELRGGLADAGYSSREIEASSVAASLPEGGAAISYLRYSSRTVLAGRGGRSVANDALLGLVVTPDGRVQRVPLGAAAEIEALARAWRASLGKPIERGMAAVARVDDEVELGVSLRERILDPLLARAGDPRTLHVVLDDFLHLVPLEALPANGADDEGVARLGDRLRLHHEVSFGRLVAGRAPPSGEGTLLAFGGIDFDAAFRSEDSPAGGPEDESRGPRQLSAVPMRFEALRQTRYEVEDVGAQFEETFQTEPRTFTRDAASKARLIEHAPSARYLHLATHGWFAPQIVRSQLDPVGIDTANQASLQRAAATVMGFAPETLCGLALAGANTGRDGVGRVPGIITAEELSSLDLRRCELAVLSACETNVGLRRAGQGIQSLQSALHAAGVRTAVTSLWKVDDAATRRLMEIFYAKLWADGLGKAEALWQAKRALRREGHPLQDWAGFVLTGDPN